MAEGRAAASIPDLRATCERVVYQAKLLKVFESCVQSLNPNLDSLVTVCFVRLLNTSTFQNYTTIYTRVRAHTHTHTHLLCTSIVFIRDVSTGESREELVLGKKKKRGKINTSTHIRQRGRERGRGRVKHNKSRICSPSVGAASRQIESLNPCTRTDTRLRQTKPKAQHWKQRYVYNL